MINFESGCPVVRCPNFRRLIKWRHHDCGATETIDSEGIVRCKNGHNLGEFFLLEYSCGMHTNDFRSGSYSQFLANISICSIFGPDFACKLCDKLMTARKEGRIKDEEL